MLPPLFLHFALVFPDRPDAWVRSRAGRLALAVLYLPAVILGAARVAAVGGWVRGDAASAWLERIEWLAYAVPRGVPDRRSCADDPRAPAPALGHRQAPAPVDRLGIGRGRRAVRHHLRRAAAGRCRAAARRVHGRAARLRAAVVRVGARAVSPHGHRGDHQARAARGGRGRAAGGHLQRHAVAGRPRARRRQRPGQLLGADVDADRRAGRAAALERHPERARSALLPRSLRLPPRARRLRARAEQRPRSAPAQHEAGRSRPRDARRRADGAATDRRVRRDRAVHAGGGRRVRPGGLPPGRSAIRAGHAARGGADDLRRRSGDGAAAAVARDARSGARPAWSCSCPACRTT